MGIKGLLPKILPSAGREDYDLRALSDGILVSPPSPDPRDDDDDDDDGGGGGGRTADGPPEEEPPAKRSRRWTRRRVRVAVDVNGWIARAAHGYGGSLLDERHLSYHGRAELRHERTVREQREQRRRQQPEGGGNRPNDDGPATATTTATTATTNEQIIQEKQRAEYVSKCVAFVLSRIAFLRDECDALVLPVLDGATPPVKRGAVARRSERRGRASERRDGVAQSPARPAAAAAAGGNAGDSAGEDPPGGEASRTEAEALRRISASKRAGTGTDQALRRELLGGLLEEFRERGWPFLVAPYEADGQLAHLARTGAADLVVTEDSDLIGLGCPTLVYRLGGWNGTNPANRADAAVAGLGRAGGIEGPSSGSNLRGTMLHRRDLGSSAGIDLMDFSDAMLAVMFVAAGCDYCASLRGVGIVTARNVVKRAFHGGEADVGYYRATGDAPVLRAVLDDLFRSCHRDARERVLPLDDPGKEEVRRAYERSFLAALAMFRHPLVYDPVLRVHAVANDVCDDGDAVLPAEGLFLADERILMEYESYRDLVTRREELYRVVGAPFPVKIARGIAEGLIDPRKVLAPDLAQYGASGSVPPANENATLEEDGHRDEEDESAGNLTMQTQDFMGVSAQQSTQESRFTQDSSGIKSQNFSAAGTQQSKASSAASGMISSLSPDLLGSPSPQTHD